MPSASGTGISARLPMRKFVNSSMMRHTPQWRSIDDQPDDPMNDVSFNARTASLFRECAELLRQQQANPFRVNAYLRAAATLENLQTDAREILDVRGRDVITSYSIHYTKLYEPAARETRA